MRALAKQNGLQFPYVIYAQQELSMPASEHHRTQSSSRQSLPSKTTANAQTTRQGSVPVANSSNSAKPSDSWQWPVNSTLEHRFIRDASGLSILEVYGVSGEDVRSVASGKVVYAGNGIINYGWMLVVKHDDDYMSIYAHNSALFVKEGDRVAKGQKVAELGATGNTTQSKLYLEARYQGRKIDVLKVLKK